MPLAWHTSPARQSEIDTARLNQLDFSSARQADSSIRIKNSDEFLPAPTTFFKIADSEYVAVDEVWGNQTLYTFVCKLGSGKKALECWNSERTAMTRSIFAPDYRYVAAWAPEVQFGLKIQQLPALRTCDRIEGPGERAIAGGFTPDGKLLGIASRDGEIWIYAVGDGCEVTLQRRIFSPQVANWGSELGTDPAASASTAITLNFVTPQAVVVTYGNEQITAFDARSGLLKWSRSGFGARTVRSMSVSASPDRELLAAWTPQAIQLMHSETGIALSGTFEVIPTSSPTERILRVGWSEDSVLVEAGDEIDPKRPRVLRRRITPVQAEAQFLQGVPTSALTELSATKQ